MHSGRVKAATVVMALTLLVILAVPAAVVLCSPFAAGLTYVVAGSTATVYASLYGPRIAWSTAAATTLLVLLVEASRPSPIAAVVLMVVVGLVIGACSIRGWHPIAILAAGWPASLLVSAPFAFPV